MNSQKPTETHNVSSLPPTRKSRIPFRKETDPNAPSSSKLATIKSQAKNIAAVIGVVTVVGVVAAQIAKKKTGAETVTVTLPNLDVTTEAS